MDNEEQQIFNAFKKYYSNPVFIVKDIIPENPVDVILVLESPHTTEIKTGIPVSGSSGKNISDNVFGSKGFPPFGIYIMSIFSQFNVE